MHFSRSLVLAVSLATGAACMSCAKDPPKAVADTSDAAAKKRDLMPSFVPELDTNAPLVALLPSNPSSGASTDDPAGSPPSGSGARAGGAQAPLSAGAPAEMATVKLLSAGAEPREKLRYKFKAGAGETLTSELRSTVHIEAPGMQEPDMGGPPIKMVSAVDLKTVSPEGDLRYEYHLTSLGLGDSAGLPPQAMAQAKQELSALVGLGGYVVITSRGLTKDARLQAPAQASTQVLQLLEQYQQTLRAIAPAFPDEAVGKGAKWVKTATVLTAEQKATQDETYTLTDLTGDQGTLDIAVAQSSPAQALGGLPPGMNARLESAKASGKGASTFDVNRLVPSSQQVDATSITSYVADQNGETQHMKVTLHVRVKIAGTRP